MARRGAGLKGAYLVVGEPFKEIPGIVELPHVGEAKPAMLVKALAAFGRSKLALEPAAMPLADARARRRNLFAGWRRVDADVEPEFRAIWFALAHA